MPTLKRDQRGNESQLSTNFLGHFQLTNALYPALKQANHARIIVMSSRAQSWNGVDFDDPNFNHRKYDAHTAYAQSKAADALFAVALDKRAAKDDIHAFAVHPGIVPGTDLSRNVTGNEALKKASAFALNQLEFTHMINTGNSIKAKLAHEREYDYFKTVSQALPALCGPQRVPNWLIWAASLSKTATLAMLNQPTALPSSAFGRGQLTKKRLIGCGNWANS